MKYRFLILAELFYILIFFIFFPLSRYSLNADGIAYIQEAKLFADGHFATALNGCWNGLICLLISPFIKSGFDPVVVFKCFNGFLGALSIYSFYLLTTRFIKEKILLILIPFSLSIIIASYSLQLLSPDVLQLLLISIYLNIVCTPDFFNSTKKLVLCGIVGALCYFAKSYNFYFFILNTLIALVLCIPKQKNKGFYKFYLSRASIVIVSFLVIVSPYVLLLSNKYDRFTISTAGPITINKSLEPAFTDGEKLVVPPPNQYALAIADDPTYFQKKYITPFNSTHYFLKQIKITIANVFEYARLLTNISFFSIAIFLAFAIYLLSKKKFENAGNEKIIFLSAFLYPLGYLLIAIEWRYIWNVPILLIIMAGILIQHLQPFISKQIFNILIVVIFSSFLTLPVLSLIRLDNQPKIYATADSLKKNGIVGNFVANLNGWRSASNSYFYSYLNNSKLYGLFSPDFTYDKVMESANKYDIKYFYYYYNSKYEKDSILISAFAKNAIKVFENISADMIVFQLK